MTLLDWLWNSSPASLSRGLKRRWDERQLKAGWVMIKEGVLAGVEIYVPPSGTLWTQMISGHYDQFLYDAVLDSHNPRGAMVWDIGAHVGYHSLAFAALGAEVLAFEPNAANVERLEMNLKRNSKLAAHVRYLPKAVCDTDGQLNFKQSLDLRGTSTGSYLTRGLPPLEPQGYAGFTETTVSAARIDTLIEKEGERPPDILKIDVEGSEELVLRGGSNLLVNRRPVLLIEVHHICLMFSIQKMLLEWGYETRLLDTEHASASRCFIIAEKQKS